MQLELNPTEQALVERAQVFAANQVADHAAEWERRRIVPLEALRTAAGLGLTGIEVPVADGGQGLRYRAKLKLAEEMSRHCMAFVFSLINTHNVAAKLARCGASRHKLDFLPKLLSAERIGATALTEPGAGSDFTAITTGAEKVAEGWRLGGEKAWITNAAVADLFLVYAQTDPAQGWRGIACFLVDATRPGFERLPAYELMGGHAIGTGGFRLDGYVAAEDDVIHPPGEAFKAAMASINGARTYVAAMCCGMLASGLDLAVAQLSERQAFGSPLIERQGLRWMLADVATELEAARLLTLSAALAVEAGEDRAIAAAAHAKKFAARTATSRLPDLIQALGARGLETRFPLGRHLACAKIAHYVDGTTEIQNERIAALLVKGR